MAQNNLLLADVPLRNYSLVKTENLKVYNSAQFFLWLQQLHHQPQLYRYQHVLISDCATDLKEQAMSLNDWTTIVGIMQYSWLAISDTVCVSTDCKHCLESILSLESSTLVSKNATSSDIFNNFVMYGNRITHAMIRFEDIKKAISPRQQRYLHLLVP